MRHKKLKLSTLIILVLGLTGLQAQETIPASGGNSSGNNGSIAFSIGQVFCSTNSANDGSISEGVQQPYEITVAIDSPIGKDVNMILSAYPNPAKDVLMLSIENDDIRDVVFLLFDMKGNVLFEEKVTANKTTINMGSLLPATYFLKVFRNKTEIKIFKIIKTH
jgi:hypothetical protein